ncbi:conserved hypothetical protein [Mesorhizobium escarrei]|uniref:Uncharacterized protein n=1 Tax=Mesorhizobium escarrei TaxID=666018 RepID=A0ABM9DS97_9HYPH|nr:conserved hypothetical protein [Mesorhizobium escarrei]
MHWRSGPNNLIKIDGRPGGLGEPISDHQPFWYGHEIVTVVPLVSYIPGDKVEQWETGTGVQSQPLIWVQT